MTDKHHALALLGDMLALAGTGSYVVDCRYPDGRQIPWWFQARRARRVLARFEPELWDCDPCVNAVPFVHRGERNLYADSALLWVRTESGAAAAQLRTFKPRPAVVLREGESVRYTAFWPLLEPVRGRALDHANRQLAHALGCAKKWGDSGFRLWLPGTIVRGQPQCPACHRVLVDYSAVCRKCARGAVRADRTPLPIVLARCVGDVFALQDVTGRLPEPPDPGAWLERQRAKERQQRAVRR